MSIENNEVIVPQDNPLKAPLHPLLWAWGLRNPWRFSFDKATGSCIVGDVGESNSEAIYQVEAGSNCGWPITEGSLPFSSKFKMAPGKLENPVFEYGPEMGRSVVGGYVYRGSRPELQGLYIFADSSKTWPHRMGMKPTGQIYALRPGQGTWKQVSLKISGIPPGQLFTSLAENNSGELFLMSKQAFGPTGLTGTIYKLT